ncbi:D-serine dehydratase [Aerococcus urinaehominis]|uniref:Probable D-serine dehydratase n=1 Tax=Aerococcus urinaehominis TaxID=128944 RepID=A0A0X8FM28_9LACT|nr:D-serine ammonia-lyase [Aerococcus urinaehominis]AMB99785.1 D-serine dehydratase [Aerococcus urinaehominis]SDM09111.1 D-serine ammonia-lyase [Aerococcus urinaehominis]
MSLDQYLSKQPQLAQVLNYEPIFWINDHYHGVDQANQVSQYSVADVKDAEDRLARFAPFIADRFPDTQANNGLIESYISKTDQFKAYLEDKYDTQIKGDYYLKRDDDLPIAGTIKARGAIYEVLKHAEDMALEAGLLTGYDDDYRKFASDDFQNFFKDYEIVVGTTGNLGISSGVMGAALGFSVTIHMSEEAKQWKKDFLRSHGIQVVEHKTNFTEAVNQGRAASDADPKSYFVDDEHSVNLFLGYTVAGSRLKQQLDEAGIVVDADHPLFVFNPCGIGGSPGGICFGLKQIFGDHVHCFFAQPTHMPSMLLGVMTEKYAGISVTDAGLDAKTNMDGLAVPRTSGFVAELMHNYFNGGITITEEDQKELLTAMIDTENIPLEPAALAGTPGPAMLFATEAGQAYLDKYDLRDKMDQATHIAWATGGSMVPADEMQAFYDEGKDLVAK